MTTFIPICEAIFSRETIDIHNMIDCKSFVLSRRYQYYSQLNLGQVSLFSTKYKSGTNSLVTAKPLIFNFKFHLKLH